MPIPSVTDLARIVDLNLRRARVRSPGKRILSKLFEIVYFTSLKTEEGRSLQIRLVLVDPNNSDPTKPRNPRPDRWQITKLASPLPLTVPVLMKLSKAADPWSSSLAVYYDNAAEFFVWGLVDQTVHFNKQLVRETEAGGYAPPGLFQVVATGIADMTVYREFDFVARLAQDTLLRKQADVFWNGPVSKLLQIGVNNYRTAVWRRFREATDQNEWDYFLQDKWLSTLCRILISIQRYHHGGALLLTTQRTELDIKYGLRYSRLPSALTKLAIATITKDLVGMKLSDKYLDKGRGYLPADLYLDEAVADGDASDGEAEITGCVRFISALSCVDGLILSTPGLEVRGFGVEIRTKKEADAVFVSTTPAIRESALSRVEANHYGTRHRSMMRYCFAHPHSLGFVISQDGEIRAMTRVGKRLIMWENLKVLSSWEDLKKVERTKSGTKPDAS